jgi:hypothetical protein
VADRLCWMLITVCSAMIFAPPTQAQSGSFEQASAAFVQRYVEAWSSPAPDALAYMDQVYPDQVYFYGKELTHTALMNLKHRFALRWPERALSVRPDSIQVMCDPNHLCSVEAIYDWHYRSPERQAESLGSATLQLKLQDGMTILSEYGSVIPSNQNRLFTTQAQRAPLSLPATHPAVPTAPVTEAHPPAEEGDPQWRETTPSPDDIVALRNTYATHGGDKDWITAWLAQKHDFSGQAIVVGATEGQAAAGASGSVHTVGFTSAAGTVACINPADATALKVGEKVNLHGEITIFIDDVMYLGQCAIQPG